MFDLNCFYLNFVCFDLFYDLQKISPLWYGSSTRKLVDLNVSQSLKHCLTQEVLFGGIARLESVGKSRDFYHSFGAGKLKSGFFLPYMLESREAFVWDTR